MNTFLGLPIVDGDDTDVRHIEPRGVVVALYAKGRGKNDTSGIRGEVTNELKRSILKLERPAMDWRPIAGLTLSPPYETRRPICAKQR